jgi:hypothetical protein
MNAHDKKLIKIDVLMMYKQLSKPIFVKWDSKYKTIVIRNELMKVIIDHCNRRTTDSIYKFERKKYYNKIKKQKRIEQNNNKDFAVESQKFVSSLFE